VTIFFYTQNLRQKNKIEYLVSIVIFVGQSLYLFEMSGCGEKPTLRFIASTLVNSKDAPSFLLDNLKDMLDTDDRSYEATEKITKMVNVVDLFFDTWILCREQYLRGDLDDGGVNKPLSIDDAYMVHARKFLQVMPKPLSVVPPYL
jgi:hypothetical protein